MRIVLILSHHFQEPNFTLLSLNIAFVSSPCSRVIIFQNPIPSRGEHERALTGVDANVRSAFVSNARYDLALTLVRGAAHYDGKCVIRFDAAVLPAKAPAAASAESSSSSSVLNPPNPFFIDYTGHSIQSLRVNGHDCTACALKEGWWRDERLTIPLARAQPGANTVEIAYRNAYDHGGDGFHQFTDPVDGCEYLYTNFEPFFAVRFTLNHEMKKLSSLSIFNAIHTELLVSFLPPHSTACFRALTSPTSRRA